MSDSGSASGAHESDSDPSEQNDDKSNRSASPAENPDPDATPPRKRSKKGRPTGSGKLTESAKKLRRRVTNQKQRKQHKTISGISLNTYNRLHGFKQRHFSVQKTSWDAVFQELLKNHPDPGRPRAQRSSLTPVAKKPETAEPQSDSQSESDNVLENHLRMVCTTRMVVEGQVSVAKVPLVLALSSMFFTGRVGDDIPCESTVERHMKKLFAYDIVFLREAIKDALAVHLQPDISATR